MFGKILLVVAILALFLIGWAAYGIWLGSGTDEEVLVHIPEGASFQDVLDSLERSDVPANRTLLRLYAVASGTDTEIRPGTYKFTRGIAAARIMSALQEGRSTVREKVTFPEGITVRRIASIAAERIGVDSAELVRLANDTAFLRSLGIDAPTAEGYLMPDTYFFFWGVGAEHVLREMHALFSAFYTQELRQKAGEQRLTPYEALILASIVEGEARVAEERPIIAGLYLNRLRKGIKLQADPTIQYVIPGGPRRLLYRDLRYDSPYNTYKHAGLPPTPINNPSRSSIRAVLEPAEHSYIYMVAKADGSGRHTFTRTGREHQQATQEFRRNRREQMRQAEEVSK